MERSKLKWGVILLLALLNAVLLGMMVQQDRESRAYAQAGRTQALVWLQNNGIEVQEGCIPWESGLASQGKGLEKQVLGGLPPEGLPEDCSIQNRREPETLLRDFVLELRRLGASCGRIQRITEGYWYSEAERLLTPVWEIETDQGKYQLDGYTGELTQMGDADIF